MVNLALLSAWHVHTRWFVRAALETGNATLKVVWDDDEARGRAFAEEFGVAFEADLDAVLGRADIDGVMVECATTQHKEVIVKAARAKKHVFSDKALATNMVDALEIKRAIAENGVKFVASLEHRSMGVYRYAKQLIQEGKLGRVTSVYFSRAHGAVLGNWLPAYWFDPTQTGGGVTIDLGCHGFYLLPWFCGTPTDVTCLMGELYETGNDEISTTVVRFESGAIGTAHTSFVASPMDNLLEIIGTEGILVATGQNESNYRVMLQSKHVPGHEQLVPVPKGALPADEILPCAQFVNLVASNDIESLPDFDIDSAVALTRLIESAYKSARERRVVTY